MSRNYSKFETVNPSLLYRISKMLIDKGFDYDKELPYTVNHFDENMNILKELVSAMGLGSVEDMDYEFFYHFINKNENKIINKELDFDIPKPKRYKVEYRVSGSAYITENYEEKIYSYDKNIARRKLQFLYDEGSFDYWSGDRTDIQYEDFDINHFVIDYVSTVSESVKQKVVLEETEKKIGKLDRQTLESLKEIIDKRLNEL